MSPEDFDRIVTWIDLNAPYYPSYASAYPDNLAGRCPLDDGQLARLEKLTGVPLRKQAGFWQQRRTAGQLRASGFKPVPGKVHGQIRPASIWKPWKIIRAGQKQLAQRPEADMPQFQPCELDQWRNEKYLTRWQTEQANREAIRTGQKRFEIAPK